MVPIDGDSDINASAAFYDERASAPFPAAGSVTRIASGQDSKILLKSG